MCEFRHQEAAAIVIDRSLLRDVHRNGLPATELLKMLLQRQGEKLKAHVSPNPDCWIPLVELLEREIKRTGVSCYPWKELLEYACGGFNDDVRLTMSSHIRGCEWCGRDIHQMKDKLPQYGMFRAA